MKSICVIIVIFFSSALYGNNIQISGVSFNSSTNEISFTLEYENAWTWRQFEPDTFDAAWVWIKYAPNGGDSWYHAEILDSIPIQNFIQYISYDDLGIMIYKSPEGIEDFGPQQFTLELADLVGSFQDFKVFATEMVFIDDGNFNAGDAFSDGRFYQNGNTFKPLNITNENEIIRGENQNEFNQVGSTSISNITAGFPKGYHRIYCMKYKITTKQYMDFLNCLQRTQQANRIQSDISGSTVTNRYVITNTTIVNDRNPIKVDENIGTGPILFYLDLDEDDIPNESNDGAHLPINHLSAADVFAYLDWCGMRPMTELEYEKICRGRDAQPVANEYAWGTDTYNDAGAIQNSGEDNENTSQVGILTSLYSSNPLRCGFAATSTSNRVEAGATFWGVQDIHNLGEFMIGVNSLNFTRDSYGDGNVTILGNVDVPGWTDNSELLSSENSAQPSPISEGKTIITDTERSAYLGARGVRKLIQE